MFAGIIAALLTFLAAATVERAPATAVHYCEMLPPGQVALRDEDGRYCAVPVLEPRGMSYEEWRALERPRVRPVTLRECLQDGTGGRLDEAAMLAEVARYDWTPFSEREVTRAFMAESGGCVAVVSPTDDHGCTQIHRGEDEQRRYDFDRIRGSCAYAVEVAHDLYWRREHAGMCGICAWMAAEGDLW